MYPRAVWGVGTSRPSPSTPLTPLHSCVRPPARGTYLGLRGTYSGRFSRAPRPGLCRRVSALRPISTRAPVTGLLRSLLPARSAPVSTSGHGIIYMGQNVKITMHTYVNPRLRHLISLGMLIINSYVDRQWDSRDGSNLPRH